MPILNTVEIQNLIEQNIVGNERLGKSITLPEGDYHITDTLTINSTFGLKISGTGGGTRIFYDGPSNKPVFSLQDTDRCHLSNLQILAPNGALCGIQITNTATRQYIPTACIFEDISFGINIPTFEHCVMLYNDLTNDNNNELHRFIRCNFASYKQSAVKVSGTQIHALTFYDCGMLACSLNGTFSPYGIWCQNGAYINWHGGSGGYHSISDFYFERFALENTIMNWNSEGSTMLAIYFTTFQTTTAPLNIIGCRWDGKPSNDGVIIRGFTPGPVNIIGNTFSAIQSNIPARIWWSTFPGSPGYINVIGNGINRNGKYSKLNNDLFIIAGNDIKVNYQGNTFQDMAEGIANSGDQDVLINGLPIASDIQNGIVTTKAQNLIGSKTFINEYNKTTGLVIQSYHSDGRMTLRNSGAPKGMMFWKGSNVIEFEKGVNVLSLGTTTLNNDVGYACNNGQSYFVSNANHLKITSTSGSAPNATIDIYPVRYAGTDYPNLALTSKSIEFYSHGGNHPSGPREKFISKFDKNGLTLGDIQFNPIGNGDMEIKSSLGSVKLSQLIQVVNAPHITPIEISPIAGIEVSITNEQITQKAQ